MEIAWWRHQMEIFSALLAVCKGNSPVTGEFLAQRPVTRSFDVFFDLRLIDDLRRHRANYDVTVVLCLVLIVVRSWHNLTQNISSSQMEIYTLYAGLGNARSKVQSPAKWRLFRLDLNVLICGISAMSKAPIIRFKCKSVPSQNAPFELRHVLNPGIISHVSGKGISIGSDNISQE